MKTKVPFCSELTLHKLKKLCGNDLLLDHSDRYAYSYDNSRSQAVPDAVVFARDTQQLSQIIKLCYNEKIPVVARGRGTGTVGGTIPLQHGIVISFEHMNKILHIDADNRYLVAQPGVTNAEIQSAANEFGFFWPPDPTSAAYCSIGGNIGFNSAGPRAVKYGTTRENVLGLSAITGTGELIKTGVYTTKGVVGYDLTRLLIGSEGTLALITEATLKLIPKPETTKTIQLLYSNTISATQAVTDIMRQSVIPSALEFIDAACLKLIRNYKPELQLPEQAAGMLMVNVDGLENGIKYSIDRIIKAASNSGLISHATANNPSDSENLWLARKALSPALRNIAPKKINEDIVVPVSTLSTLIQELENISEKFSIPIVNFGHAGNGNIHVNLLIDTDNPVQMKNAEDCLDQVFELVLKLKGTLSGEHGVGIEKRDFVERELDKTALTLMRKIKSQFDPRGILNPDKMFPFTESK